MITFPRFVLALSLALALVLAPLSLVSTGCTPQQLRIASAALGAVGPLACTAGIAQIPDVPGWSITACAEAAELVSRTLLAAANAEVDAGPAPVPSAMAVAAPRRIERPRCVGVVAEGRTVALACRATP